MTNPESHKMNLIIYRSENIPTPTNSQNYNPKRGQKMKYFMKFRKILNQSG